MSKVYQPVAFALLVWVLVVVSIVVIKGNGHSSGASTNPFSQQFFLSLCAEDEVLGMSAKFGADKVGCIHREGNVLEP